MMILQNTFVKAIIVPIILAFVAASAEAICALVKGRSKGQYRFRVWIRQQQEDSTSVVALHNQSLETIRERDDVVDIDSMASFNIADFSTVGIDLAIGAFAVDVASLIEGRGNSTIITYLLVAHLGLLLGTMGFVMASQLSPPDDEKARRYSSLIAILIGLAAMILAFLVI